MRLAILALSGLLAVATAANGPSNGPRVCVKNTVSGLKFPIHVNLRGTVLEVKETISKLNPDTLSPTKQELRFKGQALDDTQTLEHYNIEHHSDLELAYESEGLDENHGQNFKAIRKPGNRKGKKMGPMPATLEIWTPGTITFTVDIDLTDTVGDLKKKIEKQEEYAVEDQQIFYQSYVTPLEDWRSLESYKLLDASRVMLRVPPSWCNIY